MPHSNKQSDAFLSIHAHIHDSWQGEVIFLPFECAEQLVSEAEEEEDGK